MSLDHLCTKELLAQTFFTSPVTPLLAVRAVRLDENRGVPKTRLADYPA